MPKKLLAKPSKKKKELGAFKSKGIKRDKHKSNSSNNPNRVIKGKKPHSYRDKPTIKLLNLYNDKPDDEQRRKRPELPANIEPDRRWFGNTRTITQTELELFRKEVKEATADPYTMLLKKTKLPISLISEPNDKEKKPPILDIESFDQTFGPKSRRKRPKLSNFSLEHIAKEAETKIEVYEEEKDTNIVDAYGLKTDARDRKLEAGQSRRI